MTTEPAVDKRALLAAKLRSRLVAPAPLAPNQARLWYLQQLDPSSSAYHETVALRLRGHLDEAALEHALGGLVARHEWLRSRVERSDDGPVQVVDPSAEVAVARHELDPAAGDDALARWVDEVASEPFELATTPPWRAALGRIGDGDAVLVLVVHHLACDATSIGVLLGELGLRYDAAVASRPVELPAPPSAADLVTRLRRRAAAPETAERARARARELAGTEPDARLPADLPAGTTEGGAGREHLELEAGLAARVAATAEDVGVTPFAVVAAAVAAVVARFTGRDDVALGVPVDLRWQLPGSDEVVAFLVETAAVPVRRAAARPLTATATGIRDAVAEALADPVPFEAVIAELRTAGDLPRTGTPLHTYVGWLDGDDSPRLGETGPEVAHLDLPLGPAKFDLNWTAIGVGRRLRLRLEHDTARVPPETARRLLAHVAHVLDVATARPERPLTDLSLLPDEEQARVVGWEGSAGEAPAADLLAVLRGGAAGDVPAVVAAGVDGRPDVTLTVEELHGRAERLARVLVARGVRPGDAVAVSSHRSAGMLVAVLGVLRAGGAFVPVDPAHPPARQQLLCDEVDARAVVGPAAWATALAAPGGRTAVGLTDDGHPVDARPAAAVDVVLPARSPDDIAYIMFTSGSTGVPKGVVVHDAAVAARVASYLPVLGDGPVRYLLHSALGFDASIWACWVLHVGGCLVVPDDAEAGDPRALARLARRHRVTDSFFVPSLYELVLEAAGAGGLPALRQVCVGGEVFPPTLAAAHGAVAPGARLLNVYGPTEVVVTSTAHRVAVPPPPGPVPIGRPHPGTVAQVLDAHGCRAPVGAPGELHLGGPGVARGYHGAAAPGASAFSRRSHGSTPDVRFYATGDVVRWSPDGELVFVGRRDRQVKLRGQRIELGEVEVALRGLPGVADAAAEVLGTGSSARLVAVVAPGGPARDEAALRDRLAATLPRSWVPDRVVGAEALPRLPSGKLDRSLIAELVALSAGAAPVGEDRAATTTERGVAATMAALLGREAVGIDDDFFDLGGHSLLAARLVGALQAQLGVELPLAAVVQGATPRQLAAAADRLLALAWAAPSDAVSLSMLRGGTGRAPLVVLARDGETGLYLRHFLRQLDPDRPLWVLLRPNGPLGGGTAPDLAAQGSAAAAVLAESFPSGEVHLLGHSASGLVALEAARQLGDRAGLTILLDTLPPVTVGDRVWDLLRAGRALLRDPAATTQSWRRTWAMRRRVDDWSGLDPATLRAMRDHQDVRAARALRVAPYRGEAVLLTTEQTRGAYDEPDLGWRRWVPALDVVALPGDHLGILMPPLVTGTVRALDEVLAPRP